MTNNVASSVLWKMLHLPIIIPTTDGPFRCAMNDTWHQSVWNQLDEAGSPPYLSSVMTATWCVINWCHTLWHQVSLIVQPMMSSAVSINLLRYSIFYRPDEATLFVMVKSYLRSNILFIYSLWELGSSFYKDLNILKKPFIYEFEKDFVATS